MVEILGALENITRARSVETVWDTLCKEMGRNGFDRLLYGFTRYRTASSFGSPDDYLILTNHPRTYTDRFLGDRLYMTAPMVGWAAENEGACSWRWIREHVDHLTPAELRVVEFNRQMGVTSGWSVSFPSVSPRAKGAIALTARQGIDQDGADEIWARNGRWLEQLCIVAHLKITTLPFGGTRRQLTARQREALEWVGDGKTTQDIATIMGLTAATIEKHLRLAREALDVETTAQAVLKASFHNQIFIVEPGPQQIAGS